MADLRGFAVSLAFLAVCSPAIAEPQIATSTGAMVTKLEILGNYAGRKLKLTVDGRVEWDGYGHLNPSGMSWLVTVQPGEAPAPVELQIETCEEPFVAEMPRDGGLYALIIQDCAIKLAK